MTFVKSFIPLVIATIVYHLGFLDGVDTFTRLVDSLVIAFIVVASADRLYESIRQSFFASSSLSKDKQQKERVTVPPHSNYNTTKRDTIPTETVESENILETSADNGIHQAHSANLSTSSEIHGTAMTTASDECTTITDNDGLKVVSHHHCSSSSNSSSPLPRDPLDNHTFETILPSINNDNQPELALLPPNQRLFKEEEETGADDDDDDDDDGVSALPPLPSIGAPSCHFSPRPTLSFSTPLRRHTVDEWMMPQAPNTPPPILSPSLSMSSAGSFDYDLVSLRRRPSRVEEMVKQFDRPHPNKNKSNKGGGGSSNKYRRYSIGGTNMADEKRHHQASSPSGRTKPYIRNRTFGFKPIIGVWEKRIELEEEMMKQVV
ncbi:hypothetical protein BDB00DRAFT_375904 [Zychaea mexicana]|uniref:uncharacterized protein n=1 Tax=Zychaea mexicana TaxID=64656 RepID=UPI0022FE3F33|nr:uncharacterized protein BDB00DRAFT_375904 [Zychaea mexicana]KAI9493327.1 hypothetical protein BDB00DRAFT_375904 [Zychaea mexicana]